MSSTSLWQQYENACHDLFPVAIVLLLLQISQYYQDMVLCYKLTAIPSVDLHYESSLRCVPSPCIMAGVTSPPWGSCVGRPGPGPLTEVWETCLLCYSVIPNSSRGEDGSNHSHGRGSHWAPNFEYRFVRQAFGFMKIIIYICSENLTIYPHF